jgi:hypothetical protein
MDCVLHRFIERALLRQYSKRWYVLMHAEMKSWRRLLRRQICSSYLDSPLLCYIPFHST